MLTDHHKERLDEIENILQSGKRTVYQIAIELFGDLQGFHVLLGCAEAYAHLEYLVDDRRIVEEGGKFAVVG